MLKRAAAKEGEDPDELEVVVKGRLAQMKKKTAEPANLPNGKYGNVMLCPSCGAQVVGGKAQCPECGYNLLSGESSSCQNGESEDQDFLDEDCVDDFSDDEVDDEGHTNIKKPKDYEFQNEILKRLLSIMPDFSNNLFTFGFFNTDDEELSLSDFALSYFKTINDLELNNPQTFKHINNNIDGFYTRVQGFDIPLPKAHTIQYKFFTRTITKVTSGIEQAHTINVKFIADQNGFIINHFQRMNNQHNPIPEKSTERELSLKELQGMFSSGGYTNRNKTLNIFIKSLLSHQQTPCDSPCVCRFPS